MPISSFKACEKENIIVPRNFILLDELEEIEKSSQYLGTISYGLESYDDNILLERWDGVIFSNRSNDVYTLKIFVGPKYPFEPPELTFTNSKPNNHFISEKGLVTSSFPLFKSWNSDMRIKDILLSLRQCIK
jgi:ubiquitin-conjugating enzyme E2 variant